MFCFDTLHTVLWLKKSFICICHYILFLYLKNMSFGNFVLMYETNLNKFLLILL